MKKIMIGSAVLFALLYNPTRLGAQLKGHHVLGDYGLKAGTQAPPGLALLGVMDWYTANTLKGDDGQKLNHVPAVNVFFAGLGLNVVTNWKILGANYGATVLFAGMTNRLEGNIVSADVPFALSDTYIQPFQLGWHTKRADFTVGYALYMPTGEFEIDGESNNGLGMWTNEFSAGTTVFLDCKKKWNVSSIFFYEIHSEKKDSERQVGDIFTASGGLGHTFYKKRDKSPIPYVFNVGGIYYTQYKVTDDNIPIGKFTFTGHKDHIWAAGLEGNTYLPGIRTSIGFRWEHEFGAHTRFEGDTYMISLAYIIKSFVKQAAPAPAAEAAPETTTPAE